MQRNDLALQIGNHILNVFDEYMGKPMGKHLVVPVLIPRSRSSKEFEFIFPSFGEWQMTVEISGPPIVEMRTGVGDWVYLKPSEFFRKAKQLGW